MNAKTLPSLWVSGAVAALVIAASPAWAHHERHYGQRLRHAHQYRPAVVVVPPVVSYRYAPPPVYYVTPPAYVVSVPAYRVPQRVYAVSPAYYGPPPVAYAPLGAIGGAVAGAAIGSSVGQGNGRTAAIAIGSVVGAMIGDQLAAGR